MSLETIGLEELLGGLPAALNDDGKSVTAKLIVDCKCHLGECILYDDKEDAIVFTNILDKQFYKLSLKEKSVKCFDLPKMLCAFGLLSSNSVASSSPSSSSSSSSSSPAYLCAWEDGFQFYDLENGTELSPMSTGEVVNPLGVPDRLNDGRCDPSGKYFICGGCVYSKGETLKVYKCYQNQQDGKLYHEAVVDEIKVTNSICWSPDSKTIYLADSTTKEIFSHDYNQADGTLSNKKLLQKKSVGMPDGSIVDAEGYIWNAVWTDGKAIGMVERIDPQTGSVVFTVHLPDNTSQASCCCFGGNNLDILFITTAWENRDNTVEPHAGGIYAVKLPNNMKGRKEARFKVAT